MVQHKGVKDATQHAIHRSQIDELFIASNEGLIEKHSKTRVTGWHNLIVFRRTSCLGQLYYLYFAVTIYQYSANHLRTPDSIIIPYSTHDDSKNNRSTCIYYIESVEKSMIISECSSIRRSMPFVSFPWWASCNVGGCACVSVLG